MSSLAALVSPAMRSPLSRIHHPLSAFKKSQTICYSTGGTACTEDAHKTRELPSIMEQPNVGLARAETLVRVQYQHPFAQTPCLRVSLEGMVQLSRPSDLNSVRGEIRRNVNLKFTRLVDSAIDHFGFKKRTEGEEAKQQPEELRSVVSDSLEEEEDGNDETVVDKSAFVQKNKEIQDLKREIAIRDKCGAEQREAMLHLSYDVRSLKDRVQNPFEVSLICRYFMG